MRTFLLTIAVTLLLIGGGLLLQAKWDGDCGEGNRWDPDIWICVDRDS